MPTSKSGTSGSRKDGRVKSAADIVESKSICLPRKYWKRLKKEAGDTSVTKYAGLVIQNHFTEENVKKVAFIYDVEEYTLLAIIFGTESEVSEYWQNNYDADSTLYTFEPTFNFTKIKVIHLTDDSENEEDDEDSSEE